MANQGGQTNDNQGGQKSHTRQGEKRGFASMDEQKQRAIASKGGQSVPDEKRSFSQDRTLASEAGRKGGEARSAQSRRSAHQNGQPPGQTTR